MVEKVKRTFDSDIERLKYQICYFYIDTKSKTWPWPVRKRWYDSPPRSSENQWNYDKLGRPFRLGQAILWFTLGKNNQPIQHLALITSYRVDTEVYYANPLKSAEYVNRYEKIIKSAGIHKGYALTDNKVEVSQLRQAFGAIILCNLYHPNYADTDLSMYAHL